jgi:hypothetical protein
MEMLFQFFCCCSVVDISDINQELVLLTVLHEAPEVDSEGREGIEVVAALELFADQGSEDVDTTPLIRINSLHSSFTTTAKK